MKLRIICFIFTAFLLNSNELQATIPDRVGWWKFDDPSNIRKAEPGYGIDLTLTGTQTTSAGPETGNGATRIGVGSYYKMQHQIPANGGGNFVNEYTLQYDFKVPEIGVWHSFFQTDISNSNDGDFFINTSGKVGVGAVGYSVYTIEPNEWYRLIVSVKNGHFFNCYLDGQLLLAGNTQSVDDRFSLESLLLIFADENGEDGTIYCSELAIWDQPLTAAQAAELGGFGHNAGPGLMTRIPYLQAQGTNTMTVCWHDIQEAETKVLYGTDSTSLGFEGLGSSEIISEPYRWHTVKRTNLSANTRYYYRVSSGGSESGIYSFKTLPDQTYSGKIRFVLLSDTHATDTTMAGKILRAARNKIVDLYGPDIENHVSGIFHSGDVVVSGSTPSQYSKQFFMPISALSTHLPTMVVAGNHELESPYFYQYLKLDDQSAFPQDTALKEKIWHLQVGNSLFIGLNTNIIDQYGEIQANWLDTRLNEAENDTSIDFVFVFFHHPPISELWIVGGTEYVRNRLLPVMEKYSKVQFVHYGHSHGYERGTVVSDKVDGDFRMVCGGGSGGPLDPWADGENKDYNEVHICISNYVFQILEIDIANQSCQNSVYSLGTLADPKESELIDRWHKVKNQAGPVTPAIENVTQTDEYVQFNTSMFSGIDSLMSVRIQVIDSSLSTPVVIDSTMHWTNIYGIDQNAKPVDLNLNINLYQSKISKTRLSDSKVYFSRVRYRDHNLKWSAWSDLTRFTTVGINEDPGLKHGYLLDQNYPNPFHNETTFSYYLPEKCNVFFRIFDSNQRLIAEINEGVKCAGTHSIQYKGENLGSNMYILEMIAGGHSISQKMTSIR